MGDVHGVGGTAGRGLTGKAAGTSALLSLLFVVVYGATNWITARRPIADVGRWFFAWEPAVIPFVPGMVVPYMSEDLFFVAAPFLCRDERELRVFVRRAGFSILAGALFFLALPLTTAWPPRPHAGGWFGALVEQSLAVPFLLEYPHNLFPALHITLGVLLVDFYRARTRGWIRGGVSAWFVLIGLSTVLTWQHHLVDLAGGLALAGFAFHLFRESAPRLAVVPNPAVGRRYGAAAAATACLAPALWPWGVFLLWPAAGLGMVAGGYFGLGPGVFRKEGGRLPLSARFVLAPVLLGHRLSLAYYRRQCRPWDEAAPGVLIGRVLTEAEATAAVRQGVTAVLDLTAEFTEAAPFRAVTYRNLPVLDLTAPTQDQLRDAASFIAAEAAKGTVYVHCKIGYSRSAAAVGAHLLAAGHAGTAEEAVVRLRRVRPAIVVRREVMEALREFARRGAGQAPGDVRS